MKHYRFHIFHRFCWERCITWERSNNMWISEKVWTLWCLVGATSSLLCYVPTKGRTHADLLPHGSLYGTAPMKINFAANSGNLESICVICRLGIIPLLSIDFRASTKWQPCLKCYRSSNLWQFLAVQWLEDRTSNRSLRWCPPCMARDVSVLVW